jgi:hypothetical protein
LAGTEAKPRASQDEVTIIATVVGAATGQPILKRIDYVGAGSEEQRNFELGDTDASPIGLMYRLGKMLRLGGQGHAIYPSLRAILPPASTSDCIHSSEVWGDVIAHTNEVMIVRFDLNGLIEERSFWWDEMSVERLEMPVGTKVIGMARLVKASETADSGDTGEATRETHEAVEREMTQLGPEACKPLGREPSSEDQDRALEDWKRIMSRPPDNRKDGSRGG